MQEAKQEVRGYIPRCANQTQEARVYSHDGPIRHRKRGYILTMDQSGAGSAGIFSRWTNRTPELPRLGLDTDRWRP
eukprot:6673010-Pyramimonas_sp.AAC.2